MLFPVHTLVFGCGVPTDGTLQHYFEHRLVRRTEARTRVAVNECFAKL